MDINNKSIGIYVHIPFCISKCSYCSFVSIYADEKKIEKYINYLLKEIISTKDLFKHKIVKTIYFGGGTPSFINGKYIDEIIKVLKEHYTICSDAEISIECNPCSITKEKLQLYKQIGINRLSFGVQSLCDETLKIIGRKHDRQTALNAINLAKEVGFNNISCDLLIGIPNQTKEQLLDDIKTLVSLDIKHISAYMLMLEEGTCLYSKVNNGELKIANDDMCVNMYECSYTLLKNLGFNRYEISNFAVNGYECKHNLNYWNVGEYIGFGLASHSYFSNYRISGIENFDKYYNYVEKLCIKNSKDIENNKNTKNNLKNILDLILKQKDCEYLSEQVKIEEYIMLGLRKTQGISLNRLKLLNYDLLKEKCSIVNDLINNNIIHIVDDNLYIDENHFGGTNQIILSLLP